MIAARTTRSTLVAVLAALSTGGAAQASTTSVTLYGLIDLGLSYERERQDAGGASSRIGMRNGTQSGSRWGLRGVEDLGDGYRVVFRLENGFQASNGTQGQGRLFGRWAYLGLAGGFGELRAGRQLVLSDSWGGIASPFGTSWAGAAASVTSGFNDGDFGIGGRINNAVTYRTPVWSGWQAALGYSFSSHDEGRFATADHDRVWTAGLRYRNGPFSTALTYERLNPNAVVRGVKRASNVQLGGAYDFDWMRLHAGYGNLRNPNTGPSAGYRRINSFVGGASFPVSGRGTVLAAYQRATASHIKGWGLGYQHDLSKRTNLYALLDRVDRRQSHMLQTVVGLRHHF
ncbi:porin [Achromobacter sp. UMC46]|uniref:porin n=1 Tax=Achromobacter sp. UMC46 TaxID=1862319 RepID=UPI0016035984|nr:porin [Achromobacter sp. UMC46]MBB1593080.1 porin [Achromobacter sp. UMC46]